VEAALEGFSEEQALSFLEDLLVESVEFDHSLVACEAKPVELLEDLVVDQLTIRRLKELDSCTGQVQHSADVRLIFRLAHQQQVLRA